MTMMIKIMTIAKTTATMKSIAVQAAWIA